MRKLLLISLFIFTFHFIKAQISGVYEMEIKDVRYSCSLVIFQDNKYCITIYEQKESDASDCSWVYAISKGNCFDRNNGLIVLKDTMNGCIQIFQKKGKNLKVIESFGFFMNKVFDKKNNTITFDSNEQDMFKKCPDFSKRWNFAKKDNFTVGKYGDIGDVLEFFPNNTYIYNVYPMTILTKGKWTKKGDIIYLRDNNLKTDFTLEIFQDAIISRKFLVCPGIPFRRMK